MDYCKEIDYSSLSTYLSCPRKFFFQYIMHLRPAGPPSLDLIFGSCWHLGLEKAYTAIRDHQLTDPKALAAISSEWFNKLWHLEAEGHFDPDIAFPKSPTRATDMYYNYWQQFAQTDSSCQIIAIEEPFTIDLGESYPNYIGRLDMALLRNDDLEIYEHKTSKYANQITFAGYNNSLQCEGYLTAGHLYFDKLPRIIYNLALCQKTKIEHFRHTVTKKLTKIDRFIFEVQEHTQQIMYQLAVLENFRHHNYAISDKEVIMPCFPRHPGLACTEYFRLCSFYDLCMMRNNPNTWSLEPPSGYVYYEWNPRTHEQQTKERLDETS